MGGRFLKGTLDHDGDGRNADQSGDNAGSQAKTASAPKGKAKK